ncbi:MAG: hypothetical protein KDC35_19895 [Acidobacteria bacterium]|nr:hypothetical protein [Acidobacteriota bacterium]
MKTHPDLSNFAARLRLTSWLACSLRYLTVVSWLMGGVILGFAATQSVDIPGWWGIVFVPVVGVVGWLKTKRPDHDQIAAFLDARHQLGGLLMANCYQGDLPIGKVRLSPSSFAWPLLGCLWFGAISVMPHEWFDHRAHTQQASIAHLTAAMIADIQRLAQAGATDDQLKELKQSIDALQSAHETDQQFWLQLDQLDANLKSFAQGFGDSLAAAAASASLMEVMLQTPMTGDSELWRQFNDHWGDQRSKHERLQALLSDATDPESASGELSQALKELMEKHKMLSDAGMVRQVQWSQAELRDLLAKLGRCDKDGSDEACRLISELGGGPGRDVLGEGPREIEAETIMEMVSGRMDTDRSQVVARTTESPELLAEHHANFRGLEVTDTGIREHQRQTLLPHHRKMVQGYFKREKP